MTPSSPLKPRPPSAWNNCHWSRSGPAATSSRCTRRCCPPPQVLGSCQHRGVGESRQPHCSQHCLCRAPERQHLRQVPPRCAGGELRPRWNCGRGGAAAGAAVGAVRWSRPRCLHAGEQRYEDPPSLALSQHRLNSAQARPGQLSKPCRHSFPLVKRGEPSAPCQIPGGCWELTV